MDHKRANVSKCVVMVAFFAMLAKGPAAIAYPVAKITDTTANATAAAGAFTGNDHAATVLGQLNTSDIFSTGLDWVFAGKSDPDDDPAFGPFANNPQTTDGTLYFDQPMPSAFVISIKAATHYSLYYFDDTHIGTTQIDFVTDGVSLNKQGDPQALSHASLFLANDDTSTTINGHMPEPSTALLALLGLAGLSRRHTRRDEQATT